MRPGRPRGGLASSVSCFTPDATGTLCGVGGSDPRTEEPKDRMGGQAATIWQAEGAIMEILGVGPEQASQKLRQLARDREQALLDTAATIVQSRGLPD